MPPGSRSVTQSKRDRYTQDGTQTHPCHLQAQPPSSPAHQCSPSACAQPGRAAAGSGPLCGRMAGHAGAQSKLNLHLGAPSGRSAPRGHRSQLMASSKCGAAASLPGSRRPRPRPALSAKWCLPKSILAAVPPSQAGAPLASLAQGRI